MLTSYILVFLLSGLISLVVTPLIPLLARKFGVMDRPDERKVHRRLVPSWGGLAIYLAFSGSIALIFLFHDAFRVLLRYHHFLVQKYLVGILVGATIITILGLIDDKKGTNPTIKLLVQVIAAIVLLWYGIRIVGINNPLGKTYLEFSLYLSFIITIIWTVTFVNAINLIDGLDGLAAGVVVIASITFFVITLFQIDKQSNVTISNRLELVAIMSMALVGSASGFLLYNFHPARIFMGDTGSMFLGFILGTITIMGTLKTVAAIAILVPIMVIGLPLLDTFLTIIRRLKRRKPLLQADREHLHHRLLDYGWGQKKTVLLMYGISGILALGAILLTFL
ncbi:undecaprenyl/decaprenyl-phosphate alpha-N-acetylglucosaminyl 1-phosphate transferase [bacterium]|nr:undecaprenyl/decaprenyl-phosphate alpha-N-acetylglucosaminyl 1-phosphate transferase [bacterium]NIN91895.1 undecaprenyl/decaprenyl-phosphate alpha-N-acetylglucosaminyl 1-phosphate transferase [bacterium]NIO18161.1 undecaprenyl/decaprenyl-phosphate alpha-N-acetylglucosaminyl 1-phosphate transferase [bacterium]NIO73136.1 undecaprenyl/decaprenyl-phosphate alpha-N-acetylglucosaminyl 1-phosphate transferase [bacterium]